MKRLLVILATWVGLAPALFAQSDFLFEDYQIFGRKEPISLGSVFSVLGNHAIFVNPANVAFVSDNRVNVGFGESGVGSGHFVSWIAPNMSISSSFQKVDKRVPGFRFGLRHEKRLLHFNFGVSLHDLGLADADRNLALGVAVKRQTDELVDQTGNGLAGGNSVSLDVGLVFKWRHLAFEMVLVDANQPELNDSGLSYGRGFILGGRFTTRSGLTIAVQGIGGNAYAGSDFGLSFGAEQSFMHNRLISRIQLTSFFAGSQATMQNLSGSIGYRIDPGKARLPLLKDLEISYALSFLALPQNVGTHMVVLTKYF